MKRLILPHIRSLILRFALLLLLYALLRLGFYWVNKGLFPEISAGEWLIILLQGARFDATAILYLNLLPFFMQILPFQFRDKVAYQWTQKFLFIVLNVFGVSVALTDYGFYPFNLKRLDSEVLGLLGAIPTMASSFAADYWYFLLLFLGFIWGLVILYRKSERASDRTFRYVPNILSYLLILGLMILGLRGGVQPRPIRPVMATNYVRLDLAPLVTNSPYTLIYSMFHRKLERKNYFSEKEANALFPIKHGMIQDGDSVGHPNIVLLIMESFSGFFVGHLGYDTSFTPFLDSLSEKSVTFTRAYANGRRSSQGLVALTAGIPALMDDPFMYSPYLSNRIYGLPKVLAGMGYRSSFFNGSDKHMLGWTDYITAVGFDHYYSREEYSEPGHYDGHWGIFDHYYLNHFIEQINGFNQPFFSTFFSLSSHDPFTIPASMKEEFNSGISVYLDALLYADWSLGQFFKKAEKEPWFENTVFIITADHTINAADKSPEQEYDMTWTKINRVGLYHIPALIYAPKLLEPRRIEKAIQQIDLYNAALELAGYSGPYYSFGRSPFESGNGNAFQYVKGVYQIIEGDYILLMKEDKSFALYNYKNDPALQSNLVLDDVALVRNLETKLKAIIQQHDNALIDNNMKL